MASKKDKLLPLLKIDNSSPIPLHYQVSEGIEKYLRKQWVKAGSSLVSERELSEHTGLSRNTIHKAYCRLKNDKVIESRPNGRKVYITRNFEASYAMRAYPTIGLVLGNKISWLINKRDFEVLDYISGVIDSACEYGFATTIITLPSVERSVDDLKKWFDNMREHLSGLIYIGDSKGEYHDKAFEVMLSEKSIPQVFMGGDPHSEHIGSVKVDVVSGMIAGIEHLLELQHKKIGLIFKKVPRRRYMQSQSFERFGDVIKAMGICHIKPNPTWTIEDFHDENCLEKELSKILLMENHPTAFICLNDWVACSAIKICEKFNFKVPDDISIIGYDDSYIGKEFNPAMTTIKHPRYLLGKTAVKVIYESRCKHVPTTELNKIIAAPLIIRHSTKLNLEIERTI